MMEFMAHQVVVEIVSANISATISDLTNHRIYLYNAELQDELTIHAVIGCGDLDTAQNLIQRRGEKIRILRNQGCTWHLKALLKRPFLIAAVLILTVISLYSSSHVLFFTVSGNKSVPTSKILEAAEQAGIHFGMPSSEVHSESVKNTMIGFLPQLRWVGITTQGSVAEISVREGKMQEREKTIPSPVCSIVAARDGIVDEITVLKGTPVCHTGQAVRKGQLLVSGYTDCGVSIRAERAHGEVFARTIRPISMFAPDITIHRSHKSQQKTRYSLSIGKNFIKLYTDSGIHDTECAKIYKDYYVVLPGEFQLPVSLRVEKFLSFDQCNDLPSSALEYGWLENQALNYLNRQMNAGSVRCSDFRLDRQKNGCLLTGKAQCTEMIGITRNEEIVPSVKND